METIELFQRFGIALAIGLLIGIERGWRERDAAAGSRVAGIRTFTLMSLLGAIWAALLPLTGPWPLITTGLVLCTGLILFQWRDVVERDEVSITSVVAGMVTFALGTFSMLGDKTIATAAGVATVMLLVSREYLHEFLRRVTWPELRSAVILLAMTFLALPILPDRAIDPWEAVNPHDIWLLTVLIAAVSYIGYIAVKLARDSKALIYGAVAGALISSTTVTLVNSRLAYSSKDHQGAAAASIAIAWIISVARMIAVAVAVNWGLFPYLAPSAVAAITVLAIAGFFFYRRGTTEATAKLHFGNPFDFLPVLGFSALLTVILIVTKVVNDSFGQLGLIPLAAVSGLADVDPITLSVARMIGPDLDAADGAAAILVAGGANLTAKAIVAIVFGGLRFGTPLAVIAVVSLLVGAIAFASF